MRVGAAATPRPPCRRRSSVSRVLEHADPIAEHRAKVDAVAGRLRGCHRAHHATVVNEDLRLDAHTLHNTALPMSLVPAGPGLAAAEVELVSEPMREYRLRNALAQAERYDYVLIDCPPSLGLLTLNGLVAADSVVIPVQCEFFALEGLGQLLETIYRVRRAFKTPLRIRGLLMTMYDGRAHLSQQVVDEVRKHFPGKVFRAVVPRNVRLAEAPSHGLPISAYDPNCTGARAYAAATQELLQGDLAGTPA